MKTKCELCNTIRGEHGYIKDKLGNVTICPNMSEKQLKEELVIYANNYNKLSERVSIEKEIENTILYKSRQEMLFWKGRFYELKHENNQLRKQINLWKLKKEQN